MNNANAIEMEKIVRDYIIVGKMIRSALTVIEHSQNIDDDERGVISTAIALIDGYQTVLAKENKINLKDLPEPCADTVGSLLKKYESERVNHGDTEQNV